MNDRPPSYSFHQNFESSSAAIPTISGGTEAYNRRNPSGARKKVGDDTNAKSKRPIESDPHLCTDFLYLIRKLWATRQTEIIDKETNPDLYVKITLRELIVFLAFLLILCLITFCMTSSVVFYFTTTLVNLFTTTQTTNPDLPQLQFTTITGMDDVWRYLEDPFIQALYTNWYGDLNETSQSSYILNENRLLGLPRLRQLKVKNNSCTVPTDFKEEIKFCYDTYSEFNEDTDPFGKFYQNVTNETAWYYQTEKQLGGSEVQGLITSYQGGGFVINLSKDVETTKAIIADLKNNLWVTRGTRAIFIDFTIYNANINLFSQIRLTFEFPATGGVVPSSTVRTSKLIRYVTSLDYFVMACEIIFAAFIVYYTLEELIEIYLNGTSYFKGFWNIVDILILIISYVCIAFNIYRQNKVNQILNTLLENEDQFKDFEFLCYWQMQFNNAVAGCVFISWMKIFKYTSFNKTMTQLTETLARCATDVAGFAVMFFIIFFAYAQLGYLIFGTQVYDFSTFAHSVFTLFRIILGDFDYESIERAQRILGPLFFLTYVFFVFFVLLNMFLAIINDTYGEVKSEIVQSEIQLTSFLKKGYNKVLEKYNLKKERIVDIQKALNTADFNNDQKIDFAELRMTLRVKGYADQEIEVLFAKYDLDGDRVLNQKEQLMMFEDLSKEHEDLKEKVKALKMSQNSENPEEEEKVERKNKRAQGVPFEDYNSLYGRIDRMESSLHGIVAKIDSVLEKLGTVEKVEHNHSEA